MSTRASIKITDDDDTLYFYRHTDGYPEGTMPTLKKFMAMVKSGAIRDNVGQAAGWLIIIGAQEYNCAKPYAKPPVTQATADALKMNDYTSDGFLRWKVGAYEPTTGVHGDEEYQYHVDLAKKTIKWTQNFPRPEIGEPDMSLSTDEFITQLQVDNGDMLAMLEFFVNSGEPITPRDYKDAEILIKRVQENQT